MNRKIFYAVILTTLLAACSSGQAPADAIKILPSHTPQPAVVSVTQTSIPFDTNFSVPVSTAQATSVPLRAEDWQNWPIVPTLSLEMLEVYAKGHALGRDAHVVSVVGDCESSSDWFLKDFSKGTRFYNLGPYAGLQATIDYFNPSLGYQSYAALRGATASTVLTQLWADHKACDKNETPLGCEYRLHNPAFAFIALGTNDVNKPAQFEPKLRTIIEYTLKEGIVPILVTKADDVEGDESINLTIARLAVEYHLPVWNFWAAAQPLPDHGLQPDGAHLTFASNFFNYPQKLEKAWPVRNLTALQVLESMRMAVQEK